MSCARNARLVAVLASWGAAERRDLPWRRTRDPWAVLVSEVMSQQTQVARVAPRWEAWMARWPTPVSLAASPLGEVIAAWHGLGYNRRAVSLHRCATTVTAEHGGVLPDDLDALQALPGVGAYTARAVLAFAHGRDVAVLDVNAARIVARAVAGRPLRRAEAQRLADSLVPPGAGWAHNSAMLDLGATVCTARRPACGRCPLASAGCCAWLATSAGAGAGAGDPAAGTGRRQSRFEGSDRQGRGRLVAALSDGPVAGDDLADVAGWPGDRTRAAAAAAGLVADGLARWRGDGGIEWPATVAQPRARVPCGADRGAHQPM